MIASDLVVLIRAKTDKLGGDLNKSKGMFDNFSKGFGKGGLFGSIMAGTSVGTIIGETIGKLADFVFRAASAFYEMAKAQAEAMDKTTALSYQLGTNTETLQAMQLSAELANVSVESFQRGMIKMRDNAVSAAQGNETMAKAFQRLDISARNIVNLPLDKQFTIISDAVKRMGGSVEAQSAIIDIFGRHAGPELYTMLIEGSNGIEEMKARLERLGLSFDNIQGNQIDAMNDALRMIKEAFYGVGRSILVGVAPYLKAASDAILDLIERIGGVSNVMSYVIDAFKMFAKAALYPLKIVHDSWNNLKIMILSVVDVLIGAAADAVSVMNMLPDEFRPQWADDFQDWADKFHSFARERSAALAFDNSQFLNIDQWFGAIEKESRKTAVAADNTRRQYAAWGGEIDAAAEKMKNLRDLSPSGEMTFGSRAAANVIAKSQSVYNDSMKQVEKNTKEQVGILKSIDTGIKKLGKQEFAPANL